MSQIAVIFEYDSSTWEFSDAEEHATDVASDLGGFLDEAIEDSSAHEVTIIIEDLNVGEIREGLREVVGIASGLSFKIEV